jgi:hypothetical protein
VATFKDRNGNDWVIEFDGPTIEQIQQSLNIDIAAEDGSGVIEACANGVLIVRACWILCQHQAKSANITAEQFGKAMAKGEVIEGAEAALRAALTDFTRPSRRDALTAVLQAQDRVETATRKQAVTQMTDPATEQAITEAFRAKMTDTIQAIVTRIGASPSSANDLLDTSDVIPEA